MEDLGLMPSPAFWRGRRVLLTGHTGFKGAWLAQWLVMLGARVTGIALPPATTPSLFAAVGLPDLLASHLCDMRDAASTVSAPGQTTNHPRLDQEMPRFLLDLAAAREAAAASPPQLAPARALSSTCLRCHRTPR